eukprot:301242-Karenia_brevis.AAC.1
MLPSPADSAAGETRPTGLTPLLEKVSLDIQDPVLTEADLATPVAEVGAEAAQKTKENPAGIIDQKAASLDQVGDPEGKAAVHSAENNPGLEDSQHDTFPGEGE